MTVDFPFCPPPDPRPRAPRRPLPPGATDCHCHLFFDPARYPLVAARSYTPPLCPPEAYLALMAAVGITRTVQVNASTYGHDNRISLDFIAALGTHRARGVAGLPVDVAEAEVDRLHRGGFRGVRLSTLVKGYGGHEALAPLGARVRPFGWHVQLHVERSAELAELESTLLAHPTPLVIDHLGRVRGGEGIASPGFRALSRLLVARDDVWVKLSSWYRLTDEPGLACADMAPIARALIALRPDRCVWGSNWPHPVWNGAMPNDGDLVDRLYDWAGDAVIAERILVANPATLYGFPG